MNDATRTTPTDETTPTAPACVLYALLDARELLCELSIIPELEGIELPHAVVVYDDTGNEIERLQPVPVTGERLRQHGANDAAIAASFLFRDLVAAELYDAHTADIAFFATHNRRGSALRNLCGGNNTVSTQVNAILRFYTARPMEDLHGHWITRDKKRQTKPTLSGIAAMAEGLLGGAVKKVTAADAIVQICDAITQAVEPLKKTHPDFILKIESILRGDRLGPEEQKIWKRALRTK